MHPKAIRPRNVHFGLTPDAPKLWHGGDAAKTAIFNGVSLFLPEGERLFVDIMRAVRGRITDPTLRTQVAGFLAQEALHAREHEAYNAVIAAQGFDVAAVLARFRVRTERIRRRYGLRRQLAIVCALEHFTALLGAELLRDPSYLAGAHPSFRRLWLWHSIEEIEHKAVAYDLYRHLFPGVMGYLVRVRVMAGGTFAFDRTVGIHLYHMLRAFGRQRSVGAWWRAINFLAGRPGLFRRPWRPYLRYYLPWFHPSQIDDGAPLEEAIHDLALPQGGNVS